MIDVVRGFVYVESGSNSGSAVLFQAGTADFTSPVPVKATLGGGAIINLHSPAFNDNYFTNVTASTWLLYEGGLNAPGALNTLYGITFGAGHAMTAGTPAPATTNTFGFGPVEFSPFTSFLSAAAPAEDRLFESGTGVAGLASFNISTTFSAAPENLAPEGSATTGIVVDNASASAQADSIYFGVVAPTNTAVKLTQGTLK
jgi:hypothetical protein